MKVGIDLVTGRASPSEYSHKSAWLYLLANQFKHADFGDVKVLHKDESWDDYDLILLNHGMEFSGSLNLFGGATNEPALKMQRLLNYKGQMLSTDIKMPDYGALGKTRLRACSDVWKNTNWDAITEVCNRIDYIRHPGNCNHLLIGDSHSFSMYTPRASVVRLDGKTLFGALKAGLKNLIQENDVDLKSLNEITVYFGNIDIRHHIMRRSNPEEVIQSMINDYEKQLKELSLKVNIVAPLPIENISRKLPKTGYFLDTPYYGTWEERTHLVNTMTEMMDSICKNNNWNLIRHPDVFYNDKGELDFSVMEKPRSVHCSRKYFRWDLVNDEFNKLWLPKEKTEDLILEF